ncbi:MAG: hypothetical protein Kow001_08470 [Acidobacteriota bacterium]
MLLSTRPGSRRLALLGAGMLLLVSAGAADSERLWQYRNLGKAFYENPTTQFQAVEMFQKALELAPDSPRERVNYGLALIRAGRTREGVEQLLAVQQATPEIPHTWFNLGILYKKEARYLEAVQQFERMVQLVPDEPISHYNLGVVLKLTGDQERSLRHFERAAELAPWMAGPYFQLYNAYRAAGREAEARRALEIFQENKRRQAGAAVPEDLDWSYYSEIYDEIEPAEAPALTPDAYRSALQLDARRLAQGITGSGGLLFTRLNGDAVELIHWSESGVQAFRPGSEDPPRRLSDLAVRRLVPADFDNDGRMDFCALLADRAVLLRQTDSGFETVELPAPGAYHDSVWLDFDHDSDLDLFLLGKASRLLRNEGGSGFADQTGSFPFVAGEAVAGAFLDLVKDTNGSDLFVAYSDRGPVLYRDRLAGSYRAEETQTLPPGAWKLQALDVDNDGWTDLLAAGPGGVRLVSNRQGRLEPGAELSGGPSVVAADLLNRGFVDLVTGSQVLMGRGRGQWVPAGNAVTGADPTAMAAADYDRDGRPDLAVLDSSGDLTLLTNRSAAGGRWLEVVLAGVRNPKLAMGAEVEVKAGALYQKQLYAGVPLLFGLDGQSRVDTVRITWPNGLIQNEPEQAVDTAVTYQEKQRLSGSCPMVFSWNGREFEFITDVLAVAPLGAAAGDGIFFQVDNDEYVQLSGESVAADGDGLFDLRITEELREVGYLDQVRLLAVDYPENLSVFTSEKFKSPPYPEFRLYGVSRRLPPVRARDHRGADVLDRIRRRDRTYPDAFERDFLGVAELHSLELDFGPEAAPDNRAVLVLHGWVDWADGSTIRRLAQDRTTHLVMPRVEVKDAEGRWVTVIEDMGVPAGKPKTIVVDMTGKFLSQSREVRIVTNLCLYWDEIFLSPDTGDPQLALREVRLAGADLRWRGFSTPVVSPDRKQPEAFDYQRWMPVSMWNPADGFYTRYGTVDELVAEVDDLLVVMGSGDELRLRFDAASLPPVPAGYRRDYLLYVNGWAKDGDLNTAFSQTVEPLPFQGMRSYPYEEGETYPDLPRLREYRDTYNTRPALRFIRPLADAGATDGRRRRN